MSEFYTAFTPIGRSKMMTATVGEPLVIAQMAVGYDADNTAYVSADDFPVDFTAFQKWRGNILGDEINADNPTWREVEANIPGNVGGFSINRLALFDAVGDLIVFGVIPLSYKPLPTQGVIKPLNIIAIFAWENVELGSVVINVDINQAEINRLAGLIEELTRRMDACNCDGSGGSTVEGTHFDIENDDLLYTTDGNYVPLQGVDFALTADGDLTATGDGLPDMNINNTGQLEVTE